MLFILMRVNEFNHVCGSNVIPSYVLLMRTSITYADYPAPRAQLIEYSYVETTNTFIVNSMSVGRHNCVFLHLLLLYY